MIIMTMSGIIRLVRRLDRKLPLPHVLFILHISLYSDDSEGRRVKRVCAFFDERYGRNRSVTDVDWSPKVLSLICYLVYVLLTRYFVQYPELSCASYNKNPAALNEPDGIVAVWNLHLLERPEFIFHSQVLPIYIMVNFSRY